MIALLVPADSLKKKKQLVKKTFPKAIPIHDLKVKKYR